MIKGLVGEKLTHSYSKIIHEKISDDEYNLYSLDLNEFNAFFQEKKFDFVNVTIPYKEKVIPFLDFICDEANKIGAVNLVINKDNKLYGYNTDYFGFIYLLQANNVDVKNKSCLILGTGGTSKTVKTVLEDLGANIVLKASRNKKDGFISYDEVYDYDFDIIINTTPVGMYPNINNRIIDLKKFKKIEFVADCIYNPLRTGLMLDALELGIKCDNGLRMLILQAIKAHEIATNDKISQLLISKIYDDLYQSKRNIVLIGMPGSGKSSIGKELSKTLNKELIDIDQYIILKEQKDIKDIFMENGETYFRMLETDVCQELSLLSGVIISTGGGIVKNKVNIDYLKANGIVYYINRDVENIISVLNEKMIEDVNRPLLKTKDDLHRLYEERKDLYLKYSDIIVDNNSELLSCVNEIIKNK